MWKYLILGAIALSGTAIAQPAPSEGGRGEGPPWGHRMMMRRMMEGGKAARFHISRGESVIDVRCAADEPMKACVDAASALLDKLSPAAK